MRLSEISRKTAETDINLSLGLDGTGECSVDTGIGFFDHMLELFARHSAFDIRLKCTGDLRVDAHHSVEDTAICLGRALADALGDMRGIVRYGSALIPMDETLILSVVDISGRACLCYDVDIKPAKVGEFDTELAEEFFAAFARSAGITLHIRQMTGSNAHHIIEAMFKSVARSLKQAVEIDAKNPDKIPSTKGTLL